MINKECSLKILPWGMLIRYLKDESGPEEKLIVEALLKREENKKSFESAREKFNAGEFSSPKPMDKEETDRVLSIFSSRKFNKENQVPGTFNAAKADAEIKPGQIWSTKRIPEGLSGKDYEPVARSMYVYILSTPRPPAFEDRELYDIFNIYMKQYHSLLVLPVSPETRYAMDSDYIIGEANNILGIPFMIETSLECAMLRVNLDRLVGELTATEDMELMNVYFHTQGMTFDREIYLKANRGKSGGDEDAQSDKEDYKLVEMENIKYLTDPAEDIYLTYRECIDLSGLFDVSEAGLADSGISNSFGFMEKLVYEEAELEYSDTGGPEERFDPALEDPVSEKELFKDGKIRLSFLTFNNRQIYLNVMLLEKAGSYSVAFRDIVSGKDVLKFRKEKPGARSSEFYRIKKALSGKIAELSVFIDKDLYTKAIIRF